MLNEITNHSFIDFLKLKGNENIVDIGAGMGTLANIIVTKYNHIRITGIELSHEQLQKAPINVNLSIIQGDESELPLENNIFDIAYTRYLLEHVKNPVTVQNEAYCVLKEGGRLFVQENNILCMQFYPECISFMVVWQKFAELQNSLGGDACIGKNYFYTLVSTKNLE